MIHLLNEVKKLEKKLHQDNRKYIMNAIKDCYNDSIHIALIPFLIQLMLPQ
jgi:hypothetical protein